MVCVHRSAGTACPVSQGAPGEGGGWRSEVHGESVRTRRTKEGGGIVAHERTGGRGLSVWGGGGLCSVITHC